MKIISGGQTGVDQAALAIAKLRGIPTGGFAPKGFITTNGPAYFLAEHFWLIESDKGYRGRTIQNVKASDVTIIIAPVDDSPGTITAVKACRANGVPYVIIHSESEYIHAVLLIKKVWYNNNSSEIVINFAGNSEATYPGAFEIGASTVSKILTELLDP